MQECFNPERPELKPTAKQQELLEDIETLSIYVCAGNRSGKSACGARIVSWLFENSHPYFKYPPEWPKSGIKIIVMGRVLDMVVTELWEKKIKLYLDAGTYEEKHTAGQLTRIVHKTNGNQILFMSHNNPITARDKAQGHTAQYVWVDELPGDLSIFTELQTRTMTDRGRFLATFTPLIRNDQIKDMVDGAQAPYGKKYVMSMLDNPLFHGREEEILAQMANYPEAERRARLYGEWYYGDKNVWPFDEKVHVAVPHGYHPSWRHVEGVDPAASSKFGLDLVAEDPKTGVWYVTKAEYIPGAAPSLLLAEVERQTAGVNITKRVCDPANDWFIKEAATVGRRYHSPKKVDRRMEMIAQLQEALVSGRIKIAPWCSDLIHELQVAQWHPTKDDTIINQKSYHLTDALMYVVDFLPKKVEPVKVLTPMERLVLQDQARRELEARSKKKRAKGRIGTIRKQRGRRW